MIRDTIAEGQASGVFHANISATVAAKIFFGALDEMATNWVLSRRRYSLVSEAETVADLFVNGVRARESQPCRDRESGTAETKEAAPPPPDPRSRRLRKRQAS